MQTKQKNVDLTYKLKRYQKFGFSLKKKKLLKNCINTNFDTKLTQFIFHLKLNFVFVS